MITTARRNDGLHLAFEAIRMAIQARQHSLLVRGYQLLEAAIDLENEFRRTQGGAPQRNRYEWLSRRFRQFDLQWHKAVTDLPGYQHFGIFNWNTPGVLVMSEFNGLIDNTEAHLVIGYGPKAMRLDGKYAPYLHACWMGVDEQDPEQYVSIGLTDGNGWYVYRRCTNDNTHYVLKVVETHIENDQAWLYGRIDQAGADCLHAAGLTDIYKEAMRKYETYRNPLENEGYGLWWTGSDWMTHRLPL